MKGNSKTWVSLFASPDPLTALCDTSFQDVFELSFNATVDIDAIQAQLCSVNLSSIDNILSTIFMSNIQIIEMAQLIFNLPEVDVQIAINISQEVAQILASLTENPLEYTSALQRYVDCPAILYAPELDLSALESYLSQVQLMDYIEEAIADWLTETNGTVTSIPTFEELFPDPDIIRQLLYQTGLPAEVVEGFLQMAPQFDQWTALFSSPDPLAAVCNSSSFADIFDQFVNASVDIQTIQTQLCSVNLTSIDAILNSIFMSNRIVAELVRVFFNVPEVEIQLAINASQEIAEILGNFLSNPSQYSIDYARIVELLQQFQVPGLNETWVQNWLAQVQLMEYVNDVLTQWITNANGTAMPVPTFGELFPDPTVLADLLRQLGLPEDMITAFLDSAIQADRWNQVWMSEDPLKTLCEAGVPRDTIAVAINSSVTAQAIQDGICSVNLTDVDDLLSSIFDLDTLIIEVSRILFNDPTLDWEGALNLSRQLSENLQQLLASPPTTAEDIEQISLSLLDGLEDILRMFGVWDKVRPYLSLTEVILGTAEHYLDITDDIIRTVLDPNAPLEDVTRYLNLTQEEIRIALLGDFIHLTYLADYYQNGLLDTLVCQEGYYNGVHLILRFEVGFINQTALQQYLCSADLQEFFADAKDLYGFDFLRWAEVSGSIFLDLKANYTVDSFADIASLVLDLTAMVQDLAALPEMLTGDIDMYALLAHVNSLSAALQAQEMELLIKSLEELAPFLNDPSVINEIRTALMSGVALMQWSSSLPTDLDAVAWLQSAQEALVETGLWQQVLPIVNFVDLLIEGQLDALMPLGFSLPHLLTNETVLNKFLTEVLDMAPEYAEALLLSEINPIMTLAELHLNGEWEEVFCAGVPQMTNSSEAEFYQVFNVSAIFSHLCHLNRTQFFEHVNSLLSVDILRLTEEFANLLNHSQTGSGSGELYDWQSLVSNVQRIIDTYETLFKLDTFDPNVNHTQIEELVMRLQHGLNTFDMEV
ncbi:uncharacterized protein [Diadema antillarum]|uniref:uncharacterized protein n=1 Tax=Diadema antillarum TaxID=105358 RepID=UPI003A8A0282